MKILFGADAIRYPLTGIGRYAYELATRLPDMPEIERMHFYYNGKVIDAIKQRPSATLHTHATGKLRKLIAKAPLIVSAFQQYSALKQIATLHKFKDYIYHGPNYYLPVHRGPRIATFHDLSVYKWPECGPSWRINYMRKELPLTLKRADVLITDSEFTRHEIAEYFNWPLHKIVSAPLAASSEYRPMSAPETAHILKQFNLVHGGYTLFVGTLDPRKNIDVLLNAYEILPAALRNAFPLVVVGYEGWKSEKTLARLRKGEAAGWARYLGFVAEDALPYLYAGARVFAFPSRYEGFGLPVLEAMQSGVPVICSNAASLPEVTGIDGALQLACDDVDAFSCAIEQALEDDNWCAVFRSRGLMRAKEFNWDITADLTISAYRLALR